MHSTKIKPLRSYPVPPKKPKKNRKDPKAKTHVKKIAVHSGENNNLVIQSHMDQL